MPVSLDIKIEFFENILIDSFEDPPPFPEGQSRDQWVMQQLQAIYSYLSAEETAELVGFTNSIHTPQRAKKYLASFRKQQEKQQAQRNHLQLSYFYSLLWPVASMPLDTSKQMANGTGISSSSSLISSLQQFQNGSDLEKISSNETPESESKTIPNLVETTQSGLRRRHQVRT